MARRIVQPFKILMPEAHREREAGETTTDQTMSITMQWISLLSGGLECHRKTGP